MTSEADVQRSLGRIEGVQAQILAELRSFKSDFAAHTKADEVSFTAAREQMFSTVGAQAERIDEFEAERNKAKGAGWVILAALGGLATLVGGAVLSVITGYLKIHT